VGFLILTSVDETRAREAAREYVTGD